MKRIELSPNGVRMVKEAFQDLNLTELKYMCVEPMDKNYEISFSVVAGTRILLSNNTNTIIIDAEKMAMILFNLLHS